VREDLGALLTAWHAVFGDAELTVGAAIQLDAEGAPYGALREAMEAVAKDGRDINTRRLGNFISRYEGRIEGGLCFRSAGTLHNTKRWRVEGAPE
jgi:hypothetical protein